MLEILANGKTVTIKLTRGEICKLLVGLDVLLMNAEDGAVTFAAIRSKVRKQLDEFDAKQEAKHD